MEPKSHHSGLKKKVYGILHHIALFAMLHSTFVAPAHEMLLAYFGKASHVWYTNSPGVTGSNPINRETSVPETGAPRSYVKNIPANNLLPEEDLKAFSAPADIQIGIIGTSKDMPVDNPSDNVFTVILDRMPESDETAYLKYELFGMNSSLSVARSINDRQSSGGYAVKKTDCWSEQKEELDNAWLKAGRNTVLFTLPEGAAHQYKIKNLSIEIQKTNALVPKLVVHKSQIQLVQGNKAYVKGFVRNAGTSVAVMAGTSRMTLNDGEFEGIVDISQQGVNNPFLLLTASDTEGLLGQELLFFDNVQEADKLYNPETFYNGAEESFTACTPLRLDTEGAYVAATDSSLTANYNISIVPLRKIDIAPMESGMVNVTKAGRAYRFLPDGAKFDTHMTIGIEYDSLLIPTGYSPKDIKTYYFDTHKKRWIAVHRDSIDTKNRLVISATNHFTDYINGIIQVPESPETNAYTPTMMSDVKAADPSAEMTIVAPPGASQKGNVNISYPINIPAGRKGLQPQLAIQYSNDGGNGWLGQDWSLNIPAITLDSRWGTPIFDAAKETELYLLAGEQLMYPGGYLPNRHQDGANNTVTTVMQSRNTSGSKRFFPRKQGSFAKIERLGTSPASYYWKVTATDGTISWYGGKTSALGGYVIKNGDATPKIVHWALYMVEDVYGNNIKYEYQAGTVGSNGANPGIQGGKYFEVKYIYYTGKDGANGNYQIDFLRETSIQRTDLNVDARLGIKRVSPYRLTGIDVKYLPDGANSLIRRYSIGYEYGHFGKSRPRYIRESTAQHSYTHNFEYYNDIRQNGVDVYFSAGIDHEICVEEDQECPDTDNDGVCNNVDACPDVPGPASNSGCPVAAVSCYTQAFSNYPGQPTSVFINGQALPNNAYQFPQALSQFITDINTVFNCNASGYITQAGQVVLTIYTNTQYYLTTAYASDPSNFAKFNVPFYGCNIARPGESVSPKDGAFSQALGSLPKNSAKTFDLSGSAGNAVGSINSVNSPNNSYQAFFNHIKNNFTIGFTSNFSLGNPDCPWLVNMDFLLQGYMPSFVSAPALLGSTKSENYSAGGYIGIGIGSNPMTKQTTFGAQYTHGWDKTMAYVALIDITGDGLEDIVLRNNDNLYYKKHLVTRTYDAEGEETVTHAFEASRPIYGINNFFRSKGESQSLNFQLSFGIYAVGGFAGRDANKTKSETNIYFTDANGDGLPDIVKNEVVYFNRIENGDPHFEPDSWNTENLVITASPKDIVVPAEYYEDDIEYPKHDVVKVWEAPATGSITIEGSIMLTDTSKQSRVTIEMKQPGGGGPANNCYHAQFPCPSWTYSIVYINNYSTSMAGGPYNICDPSFKTAFEAQFPGTTVYINNGMVYIFVSQNATQPYNTITFVYASPPPSAGSNIPPPPVQAVTHNFVLGPCTYSPPGMPVGQTFSAPGPLCLLYGADINQSQPSVNPYLATPSTACNPGGGPLLVNKGDRIYFRVHSVENGNPVVNWNPRVRYNDIAMNSITDQHGEMPFNSVSYSDGFLLSREAPVVFPGNGNAQISWSMFTVANPTDEVVYEIYKKVLQGPDPNYANATEIPVYRKTCPAGVATSVNPSSNEIAGSNIGNLVINNANATPANPVVTLFIFRVKATSNVRWKQYEWKPKMVNNITQQVIDENQVAQGTLTFSETKYPIPNYSIYKSFEGSVPYTLYDISQVTAGVAITIKPTLSGVSFNGLSGKLYFVVKRGGAFKGRRTYTINNGAVSLDNSSAISIGTAGTDKLEIGYYTDDSYLIDGGESLLNRIATTTQPVATISYTSGSVQNVSVYKASANLFHKPSAKFGPMYKQWGQFAYYPAAVTGAVMTAFGPLIKEEALEISDDDAAELEQLGQQMESQFQNVNLETGAAQFESNMNTFEAANQQLSNMAFIPMIPYRNLSPAEGYQEKWHGIHGENYVSASGYRAATMDQAFTGMDDGSEDTVQDVLFTGAYGITRYSTGKGTNLSAGVNVGFQEAGITVGIQGTKSLNGSSKMLTDYVDLNGDRYPDLMSTGNVQYTTRTGGLYAGKPLQSYYQGNASEHSNSSWGIGASASFSKGGTPSGATLPQSKRPKFTMFGGNNSTGISGNYSEGDNNTKRMWSDINGDGLADLLTRDALTGIVNVRLNLGGNLCTGLPTTAYPTGTQTSWTSFQLFTGGSRGIGGGIGVNMYGGSIEAGVSLNRNENETDNTLTDMNGDGMADLISSQDDGLKVRINKGAQFASAVPWSDYRLNEESESVSAALNAGVSFAWTWPLLFIVLKIPAINANGTPYGTTTNRTRKSITDFDGDGYPDLLEEIVPGIVRVRSSNIRRTDMLKAVNNPLGGKFTVDYKVVTPTYDNPNPLWVMTDVIVEDGYDLDGDGVDTYSKKYEYEKPKHDRREREFFGFETVKTIDYKMDEDGEPESVYRTSVSVFHNKNYFLNGLLKESYIYKGSDESQLFSKTYNIYRIKPVSTTTGLMDPNGSESSNFDTGGREGRKAAAVVLENVKNYIYELSSDPIFSNILYKYDQYGNVIEYADSGGAGTADNYKAVMTYHNLAALVNKNIVRVPRSIKVYNQANQLLRERLANVDSNTGAITEIRVKLTADPLYSDTHMTYDAFGNLLTIKYPENANGESMSYTYTYDTQENKYVVMIKDAFNYVSESTYLPKFDKVQETKDMAGNLMKYEYDDFGRLITISAPKEIENNIPYTIQFSYYPVFGDIGGNACIESGAFVPYAVTKHYDMHHSGNAIETITFMDGLARTVQVKKDIAMNINGPQDPVYEERMSVSGMAAYDEFGRVVKQYHPWHEEKHCGVNHRYKGYDTGYFTETVYDEMDRPVKSIDPESNISTTSYNLAEDFYGNMAISIKVMTQQNDNAETVTKTYKDMNGRVTSVDNLLSDSSQSSHIWTRFTYNAIGEMTGYTDGENISTEYAYDMAGRKIKLNHPDNGITTYAYDNASNLLTIQTANLAANTNLQPEDRFIKYKYEYNRLININFPPTASGSNIADVTFVYAPDGSGNETGRLVYQKDATGEQEFKYGNMGEMIYNRRVVVGPNIPTRAFVTTFDYDSWNRLVRMVYPDGETISYDYDLGGNLTRVSGTVNDQPYDYIKQTDYDHYEQRTYLLYGNKTETYYDYSPALRRLSKLNVRTSTGELMLSNNYQYDKVGNVTYIENGASPNSMNYMGGSSVNKYTYDNLNRLTAANGGFTGSPVQAEWGNHAESSYGLTMIYNSSHGIVAKKQEHIRNGQNVNANTYESGYEYYESSHKVKTITDAITQMADSFTYDLNGNMVNKLIAQSAQTDYFWDEANRLRVVAENDMMHHYIYDAGGERVLKAVSHTEAVYENGTLISNSVYLEPYTTYPSGFIVVKSDGEYSKHYYAGSQRIVSRIGDGSAEIFDVQQPRPGTDQPEDKKLDVEQLRQLQIADLTQILEKGKKGTPKFEKFEPAGKNDEKTAEDPVTVSATAHRAPPPGQLYFYHPDHLGSSSYLTDINGQPYQFFINLPFGETMAEQHSQTEDYETPYKFNGKELDETGMYYYSARYYDPKISMFFSTDPLMDRYPGFNPYIYCMENPVNLTDPTGMSPEHDYRYGNDGTITLIKKTKDKTDRLIAENGDVIADNIRKGLLSDGLNIKKNGLLIENLKGDDYYLNGYIGDLMTRISIYEQKEISWGFYYDEQSKEAAFLVLSYEFNTHDDTNYAVEKYWGKYRLYINNHTHPSFTANYGSSTPSDTDIKFAEGKTHNFIWALSGVSRYNKKGKMYAPDGTDLVRKYDEPYSKSMVKKKLGWKKKFKD